MKKRIDPVAVVAVLLLEFEEVELEIGEELEITEELEKSLVDDGVEDDTSDSSNVMYADPPAGKEILNESPGL